MQAPPYGLTGSNVYVGVWDGGIIDMTHPDLEGRVIRGETNQVSEAHYHATHVAGTLAGTGVHSEAEGGRPFQWRGVAPGAALVSYDVDTGDLIDEIGAAVQTYPILISQNSWGVTASEFFGNCDILGDYDGRAAAYDEIVTGKFGRPLTVVFSAGNNRRSKPETGCPGLDYNCINVPATAKDVLTVGAINSDDNSLAFFSSWGPTDDGRLKPELCAPGDEVGGDGGVTSTQPEASYGTLVGTSMAAPAVSGAAAILIEDYRRLYNGTDPLPATIRALLIHTAADLDEGEGLSRGPDYASGYGRLQIQAAVDQLESGGVLIGRVAQDGAQNYALQVPEGASEVKVTLVWDDPPGAENAALALVNDLDLALLGPDGTRYYPWTLDPEDPGQPARRDREDHLNPLEQIVVESPEAGSWTIRVVGTGVAEGDFQKFALVFTPPGVEAAPLAAVDGADFLEAAGNGNGHIDPGERIEEVVRVRHTDGPTGSNVTVRLTSASPWIDLLQTNAECGELAPGTVVTKLAPLSYRVRKDAPCGEPFELNFIVSVDGESFTGRVDRAVGAFLVTNTVHETLLSADTPLAVPDAGEAVASAVVPSDTGVLRKIRVGLRATHDWVEDLEVILRGPDGAETTLIPGATLDGAPDLGRGVCGDQAEMMWLDDAAADTLEDGHAPYAGVYQPAEPLSGFLGKPVDGEWTLLVRDTAVEDAGTLDCWALELTYDQAGYVCELFNQPPVAQTSRVDVIHGRATLIQFDATDPDEDPLTFRLMSQPEHGALEGFDEHLGTVVYTPDPDYAGPDRIEFEADDGYGGTAAGVVELNVLPPQADLALQFAADPSNPVCGQDFTVEVRLTNNGPNEATGVVLTNRFPEGAAFLMARAAGGGSLDLRADSVVWTVGGVAPGEEKVLTLGLRGEIPGVYTNFAAVSGAEEDPRFENNTVSSEIAVQAAADLVLGADVGPETLPLDLPVVYELAVTNLGPYPATNTILRAELGPGMELSSATQTQGEWSFENGVFVGRLGVLPPGAPAIAALTIVPRVEGSVTNAVEVLSEAWDPTPTNNAVEWIRNVKPVADLGIRWEDLEPLVGVGQTITNSLVLTNRGPAAAHEMTVRQDLPPGFRLISVEAELGEVSTNEAGVSWTFPEFEPGSEARLRFAFEAEAPTQAVFRAEAEAAELDLNLLDNALEAPVEARPTADLALALTPPEGRIVAEIPSEYGLVVTNLSEAAATEVVLRIPFTPGAELLDVSPSQGTTTNETDAVRVELGEIPALNAASVSVKFVPQAPGLIRQSAQVSAYEVDVNPDDNAVEASWEVEDYTDLALWVEAEPRPAFLESPVRLTLTVTNRGRIEAPETTIEERLPEGLELLSAEALGGEVVQDESGAIRLFFGTLPAGESVTGIVEALPRVLGVFTNQAAVGTAAYDREPTNNAAETSIEALPNADLGLSLLEAPGPAATNVPVEFHLFATNAGPSAAQGAHIRLQLPEGWAFVSGQAPGGDCLFHEAPRLVDCPMGDLEPGAAAEARIQLMPLIMGIWTHTFEIASDAADLVPDNNAASAVAEVKPEADLAVAVRSAPEFPLVGELITLTATVTNLGPHPATAAALEYIPPEGLEITGFTADSGEATFTNGVLEARWEELAPEASALLAVELKATRFGTFTNVFAARSDQPDLAAANNLAEAVIEVAPTVNLILAQEAAPSPAPIEMPYAYALTVTNAGPDIATRVTVQLEVDPAIGFYQIAASRGFWRFGEDGLEWRVGELPPQTGERLELTLIPTEEGAFTNRVSVAADQRDSAPEDNRIEHVLEARLPVDLSVRLEEPPLLILGKPALCRWVVENEGPYEASEVVLRQELPGGLALAGAEASGGEVSTNEASVELTLPALGAGESASLEVTLVPAQLGEAALSAEAAAFEVDLVPENNRIETNLTVRTEAELALRQEIDPPAVLFGEEMTIRLNLTNSGPHLAQGVVTTNLLPAGLELLSAEADAGAIETNEAGIVWTVDALETNAVAEARLTVRAAAVGTWTNAAFAAAETVDLNPEDNAAQAAARVDPVADCALTVALLTDPVALEHPLQMAWVATNAGPNAAAGVTVTNLLPESLSFLEVEADAGEFETNAQALTWRIEELPPGEARTAVVSALPLLAGWVTNRVGLFADSYDPEPTNQVQELAVEVKREADLAVEGEGLADMLLVGQGATAAFVLTNRGPAAATETVCRITLPPALDLLEVRVSQGEWETNDSGILVRLGELPPESSARIELDLAAADEGPTDIAAEVSSDEADLHPENNAAALAGEARFGADLAVGIQSNLRALCVGRNQTFFLVVTNRGPQRGTDIVVTNFFSQPINFVSAETSQGEVRPEAADLVWEVGDLDAAAFAQALIVTQPTLEGYLTNTIVLGSSSFDSAPEDNQAQWDGRIYPRGEVVVFPESHPASVLVEQPLTVSFVITNTGSAPAPETQMLVAFSTNAELLSVDFTGESYQIDPPGVMCSFGDLQPGDAARVAVHVLPKQTGLLVAQTTLFSPAIDPADPNNSARVEIAVVETPTIAFARQGNRLIISWPSVAEDFVVEYKNRLSDPEWKPLINPRVLVGDRYQVSIKLSRASRFFRLRKGDYEPTGP
ncbi:MAG: DUF11 domain-containing protein [Verrucomicrobia bacterium]|nr:DUF11 domain-containing protein [Verrucomicrobiota bacterium]